MQYKVSFSDLGTITIEADSMGDAGEKAMTWAECVVKKSVLAVTDITISIAKTVKCA